MKVFNIGLMVFALSLGFTFVQAQWLMSPLDPEIIKFQMLEPTPIGLRIIPSDTYTNSLALKKNYGVEKLTLYPTLSSSSIRFYANNLKLQTEAENLHPKTPLLKRMGIYGLEFVGGGIGTAASVYIGGLCSMYRAGGDYVNVPAGLIGYTIGNVGLTSTCTWLTGKLLGQDGSWWKSAVGVGVGCIIGIPMLYHAGYSAGFITGVRVGIFLIAPPLGAVIGYNLN